MAMKKLHKDRRGQLFLLGIMLCVIFFISVVVLIEPIKDIVTIARTSLECGTEGISTGTQMTCIITDTYLFAFVGCGIAVAIGYIVSKRFE